MLLPQKGHSANTKAANGHSFRNLIVTGAKFTLSTLAVLAVIFAIEMVDALHQPLIPFTNPSQKPLRIGGHGPELLYVVLGDSTAAGQGAGTNKGIALTTARALAANDRVTLVNLGVSGATMNDVLVRQVPKAVLLKPNVVLISAGANDATHFRSSSEVGRALDFTIKLLRQSNPNVHIVATGCPDMGSIPRFAQPLRWFAGTQTDRINGAVVPVLRKDNATYADIAGATGTTFRKDPTLFAADRFHPNDRGYALWTAVLDKTLVFRYGGALQKTKAHDDDQKTH